MPGSAFGTDEYLRLSYTTSMENISKELQRIEGLINKFKRGLHEWLKSRRGKIDKNWQIDILSYWK